MSDAETISTVVSIYDIGCMVGCLIAAIWGGRLGRKRTIFYGMAIMVVGMNVLHGTHSTLLTQIRCRHSNCIVQCSAVDRWENRICMAFQTRRYQG